LEGRAVADTLDQDVQALQEWLKKAWRYLAQPAHTRFDRQEMRQQMKLVEAKLRIGLQKVAARSAARHTATHARPGASPPDWRLLKIHA
jgi:lysyl-tRNA synthetase class I